MDIFCPCIRVCRDCTDRRQSRKLIPTEPPEDEGGYSFADSSLEKVSSGDERRSSVPLVGSSDDDEGGGSAMETSTTSATSRLASFFSKKGFRSNLKRTKSVTKLDRKRSGSNASENDTSSLVGSLKRSMSLGRLTRKRNKNPAPPEEHNLSLISSRIRTSRSHESLLSNPSAMQAVDVTTRDTEVKPVHHSVLSQDHCFHITTSHGSKYISCRTAEERDKWLSSLRRTIRPNQEHVRRSDSSLKLWIVEAKNVQPKKRYFCEILLDRKLYARTSSKLMADMLFWGEHFEFRDLPVVETITVNMFREADKKKKKDRNALVCYVNLAVADMSNKQFIEKWFNASSGTVGKSGKDNKGELPLIRMKVRHQTVNILPMDLYQDFSKYLTTDYQQLCELLEPALSVREKEEFATMLVHAMHKLGKAKSFLCDIVMCEIGRLDNEHLTFRGNSIATKAMEAYMKLVGERYLHDTLGDFVRTLVDSEEDCEVDPTKVGNNATLQCHQTSLEMYATMAWVKIINSYCYFPNELREVFTTFRDHCRKQGKEDFSDNLISGSIFLRFLCPAILSPSLFNLTQEYPQERSARNLTLIAKTIQTLANFTKFGGKEEFMTFMNRFVEREAANMKNFLKKISSEESGNQFLQYDGYIDLGRELSLLHTVLFDFLNKSSEATQKKFGQLLSILTSMSEAQDDPSVGQHHHVSRKSQIFYDNMPTTPSSAPHPHPHPNTLHPNTPPGIHTVHSAPYLDTSPTEALRDMLRQCGESEEDLHAFAARSVRDNTRETESAPPSLLLTPQKSKDELDEFSVLYSSTSMTSSSMSSSTYGGGGNSSVRAEVADVSVSSQRMNHDSLNETWSQIVSAADNNVNGDYIDLIPFMDEEGQNSSLEMECPTTNGSQISISQLSTVASSGYQSFGYSQSSSPVEAGNQVSELSQEVTRSPIINYPMQPLSFNNPLYRHQQLSHHHHHHHHHHQRQQQLFHHSQQPQPSVQPQRPMKEDSSSSLSSGDEVKQPSPVKTQRAKSARSIDPLRKLSQLSSSSGSNESLNDRPYLGGSLQQIKAQAGGGDAAGLTGATRFSLGPRGTSPAQAQSSPRVERSNTHGPPPEVPPRPDRLLAKLTLTEGTDMPPVVPPRPERTNSYCDSSSASEQRNLGMRPYQLSHSMDFGCLQQQQQANQLRRTATDSVIAKTSTPVHVNPGSSGSSSQVFSREDSFSSVHSSQSQGSLNARRLSPQSTVHMGISSVQRKLQEQERTKQEYENEVHVLRQQLVEAQVRLQSAEMRLMDHEVETHQLMEDWQSRLAESEQRIRQQQAEKDGQMKSIIERLVTIEEELRKEQAEMQKVVQEKQEVIEVQEQRLRTLDNANSKLLQALADLKEHASTHPGNDNNNSNSNTLDGRRPSSNGSSRNGMTGSLRPKLGDFTGFKSSTC
ncbi:ras GTPase-activating protein nGAP-like isoform X3 [Littorina saxatilis]|uniref:ras GTPase-activating protein nGAP-like isoform X3 n=1 Tax=Littorina saxatilis TaxID=31220 RepID=UPI0038B67EC9